MMPISPLRVILDTNILFSGLYSTEGASYCLLRAVSSGSLIPCISLNLFLEYEEILISSSKKLNLSDETISLFLDDILSVSDRVSVYFKWRPLLIDPCDDMVAETAVAAGVHYLVTHNVKDFKGLECFGVDVVTPGWLVKQMRLT